jgi:hypothetical protein
MFRLELRQVIPCRGKFPDRQDKCAEHPAIRRAHVAGLISQSRIKR